MPKLRIYEPDKETQSFQLKLTTEKITIGRKRTNHIILTHVSLSINHCQIRKVSGGYVLDDLDSTNGMTLDGENFQKIDLTESLTFYIGEVKVDFILTSEEYDSIRTEGGFISEQIRLSTSEKKSKKSKKTKQKKENSKHTQDNKNTKKENKEVLGKQPDELPNKSDIKKKPLSHFTISVISFIVTIVICLGILYYFGLL